MIALKNAFLCLTFSLHDGSPCTLTHAESGRDFLERKDARQSLWKIMAQRKCGPVELESASAANFTYQSHTGRIEMKWSGFSIDEAPDLCVMAIISLDADEADSRWQLCIEGLGSLQVVEVCFPRLVEIALKPSDHFAVPNWMGLLTSDPRAVVVDSADEPARQTWDYPGFLSVQCLALYEPGGAGLYFASNDRAALRKSFDAFGSDGGGFCLEQRHYPEAAREDLSLWQMPYDAIVGVFLGDWMTAAERYRNSQCALTWGAQSHRRRTKPPPWLEDLDLWIWNRGRSPDVVGPAIALMQAAGMPVGIFWHWWHGCSYDAGFPEYFPPREGSEAFVAAVEAAHQHGIHAIVYMNQRLWGITTESWAREGAERFAVKDLSGAIQPEIYNIFTRQPCAPMCMGTDFWRGKYAGLAEQAVTEFGVDGIYMDQACTCLSCCDPSHDHPPGGGKYWIEGFNRMEDDIRRRAGRGIVLAGEGCGEPWLPNLDLMLSLDVSRERYAGSDIWQPIPFFHAVYHADVLLFGNYASLTTPPYDEYWPPESAPGNPLELLDRKYSRQFAMEHARSFVWGQQLTLANFHPSHLLERREEVEHVLRLARLRRDARKFLRDGVMLRPPVVMLPQIDIPMSRLSIYAGREEGSVQTFQMTVSPVVACGWRASDGRVAIAVASIVEYPLHVPLMIDLCKYGFTSQVTMNRLNDDGRTNMGELHPPDNRIEIALPPRGACLIEFIRCDQPA